MKISVDPEHEEIVFRCTRAEANAIVADAGVRQCEWASMACDTIAWLERLIHAKAARVAAVEVERKLARDLSGADDDCG